MKSDDPDREELTFEREQEMRAELYKMHVDMVRVLKELSYYKSEVLMMLAHGDEYHGDQPISVAVAYVVPNNSPTEREILENLQGRLEAAVNEWKDWTKKHIAVDSNTPF